VLQTQEDPPEYHQKDSVFDALFRQHEIQNLFDDTQVDPLEFEALKSDLSYVKLYNGDVGCMVNGAGLAMATMDITVKAGTRPANFLDVGGSADQERIKRLSK
jgi:succinyl-CoA synthetase beta subunit